MQARGKSTLQQPPKGPSYAITLRIVIDKRFDGKYIGYITSPEGNLPSKIQEIRAALASVMGAVSNGSYTHHAVGTEAEAFEVIV